MKLKIKVYFQVWKELENVQTSNSLDAKSRKVQRRDWEKMWLGKSSEQQQQ